MFAKATTTRVTRNKRKEPDQNGNEKVSEKISTENVHIKEEQDVDAPLKYVVESINLGNGEEEQVLYRYRRENRQQGR